MGVYITRGMRLSIPAGGLRIGFDASGNDVSSIKVQVGIALFPLWLEIALRHLSEATAANAALATAHKEQKAEAVSRALEDEFAHGMQSIFASATAIDAFYAAMKGFSKIPDTEFAAMRDKRSSRAAHIKETLRRVFKLTPEGTSQLGDVLETIYKYRGWAVHPPAGQGDPLLHLVLQAGVEWQFVAFSHSNAREILSGSLSIISQLLKKGAAGTGPEQRECAESLLLIGPVLADWEKSFGASQPGVKQEEEQTSAQ